MHQSHSAPYHQIFLRGVRTDHGPLDVEFSRVERARCVAAAQSHTLSLGLLDGLRARGRHLHPLCTFQF